MPREITCRYDDPLDLIWVSCAADLNMHIVRSDMVFASWDGQQTLTLGVNETLDPDDCLAQMVLHEICHAIAEGRESWTKVDWGLRMDRPEQRVRELVCLRIQAELTRQYGLSEMLGSTTNLRRYYDQISAAPLQSEPHDTTADEARLAIQRHENKAIVLRLHQALRATRALANVVQDCAGQASLWSRVAFSQVVAEGAE